MKKIVFVLVCLFVVTVSAQQQNYSQVLQLLLENKRTEARNLFDKQFSKSKYNQVELLFLDALIDEEMGRIEYDATFLKNIENLPNAQYYIDPLINSNFVCGNINGEYFDDLMVEKINFLAQSKAFKNFNIVQYRKAILERKKNNLAEATTVFNAFQAIKKWQFCGVFENLNSSGLETEYEPEYYAKNDKLFNANSNGKVGWYNPKKEQNEIYHFFYNEAEYGTGIMYAQTFVTIPENKTYNLSFGTSKGLKIFVNDTEIYTNNDTGTNNIDAYTLTINLKKGTNRILFKVENERASYLAVLLRNLDTTIATELQYSDTYMPYQSSSLEEINPQEVSLPFEKYFKDLVAKNPDNVLYRILLYEAYAANEKKELAQEALEGLDVKYPKSSLIMKYFNKYYTLMDDSQKVEEIFKNMETNDKDYVLCTLNKMSDSDWLRNAPLKELEEYRDKSKQYKAIYYTNMFDFILASRNLDKEKMFSLMQNLLDNSHNNINFKQIVASLYLSLKDDKTKYLQMLEEINASVEDYEVQRMLISSYQDANRKEDAKKLMLQQINKYPYLNDYRNRYITVLNNENKYDEALQYIEENLAYYPYSFENLKKKAQVYIDKKDIKNAEKYIRESLSHNSGDSDLRERLYDITKVHDEIEDVETKDIYKLIKERRNTTLKGDFGVTYLLDEYIVNVLPEGGRKSKVTYVYEITSEKGIEEMKEYSISNYDNIIKSEVIKQDGSVVPADDGGGTLVFTDLKVGDVLFIQYDRFENSYGRFYKDFDVSCYFNSIYPEVEVSFTIIYPQDVKFNTYYHNGQMPFSTKKINGKNCMVWKKTNVPALALQEPYAPIYGDITNTLQVGTIQSWKEISNWYADLVKKNLKTDKITKNTFTEIFPNGFSNLSEEERAKKIYTYIEKNINYSSQDFRQSGYVPQKPSKTITTKLGDCKDVSTLFVSLAQMANLKANLVLVLTNDNGDAAMALPNKDFNHCIVKVWIDNKEYFLELTDKYLPFKALPMSLYQANALVISFDKAENEKSTIVKIPFTNAIKNITTSETVINVDENSKTFTNKITQQGAGKSYYNEFFLPSTTEEIRKKRIEEDFNQILKKVVTYKYAKQLSNEMFEPSMQFETQFSIQERLQTVGSLKIMPVNFIQNVYTRDIISQDTRKYDIRYMNYENTNEYHNTVFVNLPKEMKIIEIPQNKTLSFKGHSYSISYELTAPNTLKVTRNALLSWENIKPSDYPLFKKYVEEVIAAEEQIVGFK